MQCSTPQTLGWEHFILTICRQSYFTQLNKQVTSGSLLRLPTSEPLPFGVHNPSTSERQSWQNKSTTVCGSDQQDISRSEATAIKGPTKYKEHHDKHRVKGNFQEGELVWLRLGKDRLRGVGKKLNQIRYGPFKIICRIGDDACQLELLAYMEIYLMVNVEKLKLFEPSMLDNEPNEPTVEDLRLSRKLMKQDTIVETKTTTTRRGTMETFRIGRKGQRPRATKWFSQEVGQISISSSPVLEPARASSTK